MKKNPGALLSLFVSAAAWRAFCAAVLVTLGTQCAAPPMSSEGVARSSGSDALGGQARAAERRPGLGTGFGESRWSEVDSTQFVRASSQPDAVEKIYYNDRQGVGKAAGLYRPSSSGWREIADGLVSFGIKSEGGWQRTVKSERALYVIGQPGERYDILLRNETSRRVEAVVSVDGLDVLDGRPASYAKRGYVIPPHSTVRIDGWRTSMSQVAAFRFASVSNSYSAQKYGNTRNVGVIGVAVFTSPAPKPFPSPGPWRTGDLEKRRDADPFPESNRFATPPPGRRDW